MKNELIKILCRWYPNFANNEKVAEEIIKLLSPILMIPARSSQIKSIGWRDKTLYIEFFKGAVYSYSDVPESFFEALKKAESVGKYFASEIKGKFEFEKTDKVVEGGVLK